MPRNPPDARHQPEKGLKMNVYLSPKGNISMVDLFDGRLEKHGVYEMIVHPSDCVTGTDERHRYLADNRDGGGVAVWAATGRTADNLLHNGGRDPVPDLRPDLLV